MFPIPPLTPGDEIRVIAPSLSASVFEADHLERARQYLETIGFKVSYAAHLFEKNRFLSPSVEQRVEDLHAAFEDKNVKAILTVTGGFASNQLLSFLNYDLIRENPKVFCGYSDVTALGNAIYAKTGLPSLSGPHFTMYGFPQEREYLTDCFLNVAAGRFHVQLPLSQSYCDHPWRGDPFALVMKPAPSLATVQAGQAQGRLIGGNLSTFCLLLGTPFMPSLKGAVLFIEEDEDVSARGFDRLLQSILHQPDSKYLQGLVIGRFQENSKMTLEDLSAIVQSKPELRNLPIIAQAPFGHTFPMATLPIGGLCRIEAQQDEPIISFLKE